LNGINQHYFKQQKKTGKTGSRFRKSKVQIIINKYQKQKNFCIGLT